MSIETSAGRSGLLRIVSTAMSVLLGTIVCLPGRSLARHKTDSDLPIETEWKQCATILSPGSNVDSYISSSVRRDTEFVKYLMAIIYVESRFNPDAVSNKSAYGLMQMTEIAVREAQKSCNLRPVLDMDHMFDTHTNIQYGSCYLHKLNQEMHGDWIRTLIAYNGGYSALIRYEKGDTIPNETAQYIISVHRALQSCSGV